MSEVLKKLTEAAVAATIKEEVAASVQEYLRELFGDDPSILDQAIDHARDHAKKSITVDNPREPHFKSLPEFVDRFIRPMYATTLNQQDKANWSRRWYDHREAVARLDALWRCYEHKRRKDPNNFLEEFLRVNCDYHMKYLMSDDGVFAQCRKDDYASVALPVDLSKKD